MVAGCEPRMCSPCGPVVQIIVRVLDTRIDRLDVCVNGHCEWWRRPTDPRIPIGLSHEIGDHSSTIKLETFIGTHPAGTYTVRDLRLDPPSGKGCDCGGHAQLWPALGGYLVPVADGWAG